MVDIVQATTDAHIEDIITLSGEYVTWMIKMIQSEYTEIDTTPFLQAHSYEDVRKRFPGKYVPPYGRLFVAYHEGECCGCVALAPFTDTICEIQTLFVRPNFRGQGIGKTLVHHVIATAQDIGYHHMRLDTLAFMRDAQELYRSLGFISIEPYLDGAGDMAEHVRYFELDLKQDQQPSS